MARRRLHFARLMLATGVHRLLARTMPPTLLVLNYHRVHAPGQSVSDFDDGVYDVDFDTFRRQMRWLRAATQILDEEGLLQLATGSKRPRGTHFTAVTFDDGYIDCFTLVKPILDELGIRGIFFIPVDILECRRLGWWDIAAYLMKKSTRASICLRGQEYPLRTSVGQSLRSVLNMFKLQPAESTGNLVAELAQACGVDPPGKDRQSAELMDWPQVCQLRASGHSIGSHAWSHRVLATLNASDQGREISDSRRELRAITGGDIRSFAYPVGGPKHFNDTSVALVRKAGYEQAFTFNTGISSLPVADPFRIPRESAKSFALLQAKALLPGFMGLRTPAGVPTSP